VSELLLEIMGKDNVLILPERERDPKNKNRRYSHGGGGGRRGVRLNGILIGIEQKYNTDIDCFYCLKNALVTTFKNGGELFEHLIREHAEGHTPY
jgi:hypothetical protein